MNKPRLLDLFCGAGGAAVGYALAGFEVTGVDIRAQPRYPFQFVLADAMTFPLDGYDVIHASPPCQNYSTLKQFPSNQGREYPDLLPHVRRILQQSGKVWIIENVIGAPIESGVILCGTMFGLKTLRHRHFESSVLLFQPHHRKHAGTVMNGDYISVRQHFGALQKGRDALGVQWMKTDFEIAQAIPPAYTEWVGQQIKAVL